MDMGNFWSSSVEVQVGLSEWPQGKREVLLKVCKIKSLNMDGMGI